MTAVNVQYAAFFRKYHPCHVQQAGPAAHDTQIVILTLALYAFFFFLIGEPADRSASTLDMQVLGSLCALLWRPWKLVALFCHLLDITHQLHLPDARLLPIRTASSVCVCVCARVSVYIYKKRE